MVDITITNGGFDMVDKPTDNWGPHPVPSGKGFTLWLIMVNNVNNG